MKMNLKYGLLLLILLSLWQLQGTLYAQSETYRWEARDVPYTTGAESRSNYDAEDHSLPEDARDKNKTAINNNEAPDRNGGNSTGTLIIKGAKSLYKFFISDLDGKNCPFHPSCSEFLVEAVGSSGLIKGALMFADRFTRDMNLYKINHYPRHESGYLYDPAGNYTLIEGDIKYIPPNETPDEE